MDEKSDVTITRCGKLTRFVYLLALVFLVFPVALNVFRSVRSLLVSTSSTSMTLVGTSFFVVLHIGAVFFVIFRAYCVVSGKTRLESPSGGSFVSVARSTGIVLMYIGVFGQLAIYASMLIHAAPAIFAVFAYPFQATIPFGLVLFEAARILAFEEVWPNRRIDTDRLAAGHAER